MIETGLCATLRLRDAELAIARVALAEELSLGIAGDAEVIAGADVAIEEAVGSDAVVSFTADGAEVRRFSLYVAGVRFAGLDRGLHRYRVELTDRLERMALGKSTRKFRDKSAQQIVERLFAEHGVAAVWKLGAPPPLRPYTVQYRESHRAFVERLLEQEGIYYAIEADGSVRLGDRSPNEPLLAGASPLGIREVGGALGWAAPGLYEVRRGARLASGAVTLRDVSWKNPALDLTASAAGERDADLEIYDFPAGYRDPDRGAQLAARRLEAERALASRLEGRGSAFAFAAGAAFELEGAAAGSFAGAYFLVRVEHRFEAPRLGGEPDEALSEGRYDNSFVAIPRATPFRPALRHPRPTVDGNHTVMVRGPAGEEIHTDQHGRFKAQFHWDREATGSDEDSRWLRMLQECASSMTLARVGWEVSVAYVDGDPERPLGIARNINGAMQPAYGQPANKTVMAMKTPSSPATGGYNELKLDDRAGAMRFDLRAEKDMVAVVKNDRREHVGRDELHVVGQVLERAVARDQTVKVGADASAAVNADDFIAIGGRRSKTVAGSEDVEVGGSDALGVAGNDRERVGSLRLTVAGGVGAPSVASLKSKVVPSPKSAAASVAIGAVKGGAAGGAAGAAAGAGGALKGLMPQAPTTGDVLAAITQGSIQRVAQSSTTRMVGGAMVSASVGAMATSTGLAYAETVGGAKVTIAGKDIVTQAGQGLATTVGGAIVRSAGGDMGSTSQIARVQVGGLASVVSGSAVSLEADAIRMQAPAGISFTSGALALKLAPNKATMLGDLKLDAGESIKVTGSTDNLTKA